MRKSNGIFLGISLVLTLSTTILLVIFKEYQYTIIAGPLTLMIFILFVLDMKHFKNEKTTYEYSLKKVLKSYDAILANSKELPDLKNKDIIRVTNLIDFIDAQSELRKPIIYVKNENSTDFLINDEKEVIIYCLKMNDSIVTPLEEEIDKLVNKEEGVDSILNDIDNTTIIKLKNNKEFKVSPVRDKSESSSEENKNDNKEDKEEADESANDIELPTLKK